MKTNFTIICLFVLSSLSAIVAQVGINTTNPASVLDIVASDAVTPSPEDGILIPRVEDFTTTDPGADQDGMLVFLNTSSGTDTRGFYYWDNPNNRWVGFGGEWRDGVNGDGEDLIFAIQAGGAGNDIVITDDDGDGSRLGFGTDTPMERFEMKGPGDNDLQLTSANTNPPNFVVQNSGGSITNPQILPEGREIGAFIAKIIDNNGNIKETGGVRFYADETPSGGRVPTRYVVTLRERDNAGGNSNQVERLIIKPDGQTGISVPDPTASLHIQGGSNDAASAPIKFTIDGGIGNQNLMNNPERGALEYDGESLYITNHQSATPTRLQIATVGGGGAATSPATITTNLFYGNINAHSTEDGNFAPFLNGAQTNMTCSCSPNTTLPAGLIWSCFVSATNNVRVRVANITNSNINAGNLAFNITVFRED